VLVLMVEDDPRVSGPLTLALQRHGFRVRHADTGAGGVSAALENPSPDVVLLDMGLPDLDGLEVCRRIRASSRVPILAVTARGAEQARVSGLRSGADDYIVKPFGLAELLARIEAVLRRTRGELLAPTVTAGSTGDVVIDLASRQVEVAGTSVALSRKEFDLLAALARRSGAVAPRGELLAEVWGVTDTAAGKSLDVHVATLRGKLGRPDVVLTVRGVGYRLGV
jgi:DNA-binding response OmpR family regulator